VHRETSQELAVGYPLGVARRRWALVAVILGILLVLAIFAGILLYEGDDAGPGGSENEDPEPQSLAGLVSSTETSVPLAATPA